MDQQQTKVTPIPLSRYDLIGLFELASRAEMSFIESSWFNIMKVKLRPFLFPPEPAPSEGQNSPQE